MKKKIIFTLAVLVLLIPGGIFGVRKWIEHQNSPYNVSDVLDDKGVKLYKRGFRLWGWAEHVSCNNCTCHL